MRTRAQLFAYFTLAFGIAWTGVLLVASRTGLPAAPIDVSAANRYLVFLAMLAGPSLACLGLTAAVDGRRGLRELASSLGRWRIGGRWYAALAITPAILVLTLGALSLVSPRFAPAILASAAPGQVLAFAAIAGLGAGLFEELGWTGYVTPRLLQRHGWLRAGLLFGPWWMAWHVLPDYWGGAGYGSLWGAHILEWALALTAFRVLMTWVYDHTRSLLLGVLMHASFTGSQALLWPASAARADELLWYGLFVAGLWMVVAVVALGSHVRACSASHAERVRSMPGDALVREPIFDVTHAITIDAPPDQVWPWLAQMGAGRAGWYSYDRIDNGGRPSAVRLVPEHLQIRPGDVQPAVPGASREFLVVAVDPPRSLVVTVPGGGGTPIMTWEHHLERGDGGRTRLLTRGRVSSAWKQMARGASTTGGELLFIERVYHLLGRLPDGLLIAVAGAGHWIMEARHLRGIKLRAERNLRAPDAAL